MCMEKMEFLKIENIHYKRYAQTATNYNGGVYLFAGFAEPHFVNE